MKKKLIFVCSLAAILIIGIGGGCAALSIYKTDHFLPKSFINGTDVSMMSYEEAGKAVEEKLKNEYSFTVYGAGEPDKTAPAYDTVLGSITGSDIDLQIHVNIEDAVQKNNGTDVLSGLMSGNKEYEAVLTAEYNKEALQQTIGSFPTFQETNMVPPTSAYIEYNDSDKRYKIIPETLGTQIIEEKAEEAIAAAINSLQTKVILTGNCYTTPAVTAASEEMVNLLSTLNTYAAASITYDLGALSETVDISVFKDWIDTGTGEINMDMAEEWIEGFADRTDTAYTTRTFKIGDRDITVSGPYGYQIAVTKEAEQLVANIKAGQPVVREPAYNIKAASREDELGGTFVEVDLTNQHVSLYVDGTLAGESDCVTGNLSKGYDTPDGIYPLTYKQKDAVLRGPGYASPVDFWMPFNRGIGLHDASWRSSFGGNIYKTNGSHGCINLPYSMAKQIYDVAYAGMPVICHF